MNLETLPTALAVSVTVMYAWQRLVKPLVAVLEALGAAAIRKDASGMKSQVLNLYHLWPFYTSAAFCGWLAWHTGLSFLPMYGASPVLGRVLSCAMMGQGPSIVYDLMKQVEKWRADFKPTGEAPA